MRAAQMMVDKKGIMFGSRSKPFFRRQASSENFFERNKKKFPCATKSQPAKRCRRRLMMRRGEAATQTTNKSKCQILKTYSLLLR